MRASTPRGLLEVLISAAIRYGLRWSLIHQLLIEEITRLEEEMLPALKRFVARIADIDDWILVEMEFMQRCRLESERMHIAGMRPALR